MKPPSTKLLRMFQNPLMVSRSCFASPVSPSRNSQSNTTSSPGAAFSTSMSMAHSWLLEPLLGSLAPSSPLLLFICTANILNRDIIARNLPTASIIFTASMSGYIVNQPQPHSAYAVSKAGVHHLARSMAGEWVGHGIRVNSISPGIMNTRLSGGPSQMELRKLWLEKSPMVCRN